MAPRDWELEAEDMDRRPHVGGFLLALVIGLAFWSGLAFVARQWWLA